MFFHETQGTQTVNRASEYVYTSILGNADDAGFRKVDTVALVDPSLSWVRVGALPHDSGPNKDPNTCIERGDDNLWGLKKDQRI